MKPVLLASLALALSLGAGAETVPEAAPVPAPAFTASEAKADSANWRAVDPARLLIFETNKGRILIETFPEAAPNHVRQFTDIAHAGLLDGTVFHRVINGFMAQGGDIAAKTRQPSPVANLKAEFTFRRDIARLALQAPLGVAEDASTGYINGFPLATQPAFFADMSKDGLVESWMPHCRGVVSAARTDDPNSASSQFFLMRDYTPALDKKYTAWGRIIAGEDVALKLKHAPDGVNGAVKDPDVLISAKVASDLPAAKRPKAWVMRTDSEMFRTSLAAQAATNVCDLTSVPAVVE